MRAQSTTTNEVLQLPPGFDIGIASLPVYHMLCGMALEVIFKALIAQRGDDPPLTHDLNLLARTVSFDVDDHEKKLLKFYTENIYWAGRYPIPSKPTDQGLKEFWNNAHEVLTKPIDPPMSIELRVGSGATNWENFQEIWDRAAVQFRWHD